MTDKEKGSKSKSTEKPNGKQTPRKSISIAERDERVLKVFDLLMDSVPTGEILQFIKDEWNIKQVQAYSYINKARNLRIGVAQSFAKGKYASQQQKIVEEMWLLYEADATTVKQKMDILVNLDKICKGEVHGKDKKVDKWTQDMTNDNLLKLVKTGKANNEEKK